MQYCKYYKAQFMTLTAVLVVGVLIILYFSINKMIVLNPSQFVPEYVLLVKNIKEKFLEIVNLSGNCEEFKYNIEEFSKTLEKLRDFGYYVSLNVRVSPCQDPYLPIELPTTSEIEIIFSDGKTLYKEILVFSWRPS